MLLKLGQNRQRNGVHRVLPSLFGMGVAHGRPAAGVVPSAGLAGGIHLDMMLTMGVEGMED